MLATNRVWLTVVLLLAFAFLLGTVPSPTRQTTGILTGYCSDQGGIDPGGVYLTNLGRQGASDCSTPGDFYPELVPMTSSAVLSNLTVVSFNTQSWPNQGAVLTLMVNGLPTALTCTVGASGTCGEPREGAVFP